MTFLLPLAGLTALSNWILVAQGRKKGDLLTKPAVILLLMAAAALEGGLSPATLWIMVALLFSLAGDVLLLLPERFFLSGLGSFLAAHIAYVIAFTQGISGCHGPWIPAGLGIVILSSFFYARLFRALWKKGNNSYLIPTLLYTIAITAMLLSVSSTLFRPGWDIRSALLLTLGGLLFYLSDALLAWHRFITPLTHRDVKVRMTYHAAQICLVWGALLHSAP